MRVRPLKFGAVFFLLFLACGLLCAHADETVLFGGGPTGGTFIVFANGVQNYEPIQLSPSFDVQAQSSAGSVENLREINANTWQMGVVYSGHVYLGRNGLMPNDPQVYDDVMAVAWLYGAQAHLVVKKDSGIDSLIDLEGKKVNVARIGSGAYVNCELLFNHLGIWDNIDRYTMGYNDAAEAFGNGLIDAIWLFTTYPSGAVITAAMANDIDLLNIDAEASYSGFYSLYPYFIKTTIPANTYEGVTYGTPTYQDSTLWVANSGLSSDIVYEMLSIIYTDEGLAHIKAQKRTFDNMAVSTGTDCIITPFHPGAERFWREKGFIFCHGDIDNDGDVDGIDAVNLNQGSASVTLEEFAENFGGDQCCSQL